MDRRGLVGVDVDVNVGLIPFFVWMLYGVVEVFREGVDEGVEAIRVRFITVVSDSVVDVVSVGVGRVVVGFQGNGFNFCDTNFRENNDKRGTHRTATVLGVEVAVEFEVGVVEAEGDQGLDGRGREVRREDVWVVFKSLDGSGEGELHVAGCVEGLYVHGGVVGEVRMSSGVEVLLEFRGVFQAEVVVGERFEVVCQHFVEGGEGSAVEGYDRTDGSFRFVDLGLTIELWPARMKLSHFFHHVCSDLAFFFELGEDSVEFVVYGHGGVLLQLSVATRGFYVVVDFVDVLLIAEDDNGIAFISREVSQILLVVLQEFQRSPLSVGEVVRCGVLSRVVVGEESSSLVGSRRFHPIRKLRCHMLDERGKDRSRILGGLGDEL
jgi:hypothetical protein